MGIDFLRFVCAFMVICIHVGFVGKEYVLPALRISVPLFAMISGYFYPDTEKNGRKAAQIKKILVLTLLSGAIYILWDLVVSYIRGGYFWAGVSIIPYALEWLRYLVMESPELWRYCFLFNNPPSGPHLWYMGAILYVLVLVAIVDRFVHRRRLYFLIPILLIGNLLLGAYSEPLFGVQYKLIYSRNYLFTILPFFLLGDFIGSHKHKLKPGSAALGFILIASMITAYFESRFLYTHFGAEGANLYVSTIFSAVCALLLADSELPFFDRPFVKFLAGLGRKYSTGLYLMHYMVFLALGFAEKVLQRRIPAAFYGVSIVSPVSVALITLLILLFFKSLTGLWRNLQSKPQRTMK